MQDVVERHCQQVTNALVDIINIYPHQNIFIYPILDTLLLYPQKPRIISFYSSHLNPDRPIYTTLKDPEIYPSFARMLRGQSKSSRILIPTTDIYVSLHEIDTSKGIVKATFNPVSSAEMGHMADILQGLTDGREETGSGLKLLEHIALRIKEGPKIRRAASRNRPLRARPKSGGHVTAENSTPSEETIALLFEPLRSALDDAFGDYIKSPLLSRLYNRDLPFPNLFCVVQNKISQKRRHFFDYTARVLLSTNQAALIRAACGEQSCADLELPLGPNARSIADSVFASGVIDFSSEEPGVGRDDSGPGQSIFDSPRHAAERRVYGQLVEPAQVFYMPVHVGGVPWLALFTLSNKEETNLSWALNFRLYRTLIPRINERMRAGIKRVYLHLIGEKLVEALAHKDSGSLLSRVNHAWEQLTYVYPHKGVRLVENGRNGPKEMKLPDGRFVSFELYDNPHYERQIDYDLLDEQSVRDKIYHTLVRADEKRAEVEQRFWDEVLSQRHTIFNRIPLNELRNAVASDVSELSGDTRVEVDDAKRTLDILNVSLQIALRRGGSHPLKGQSFLGLLGWLKERILSSEMKPVFDFAPDAPDLPIQDEDLSAAFTVIWNLWHNASKKYPSATERHFTVKACRRDDDLALTFINQREMPEAWINYLLDEGPSPSDRQETTGLEITRHRLQQLRWPRAEVRAEDGHTHLTIVIPQRATGRD
jgi:hypothetical protein